MQNDPGWRSGPAIRNRRLLTAFCVLAVAAPCGGEAKRDGAAFVDQLIAREKSAPKKNPPATVPV